MSWSAKTKRELNLPVQCARLQYNVRQGCSNSCTRLQYNLRQGCSNSSTRLQYNVRQGCSNSCTRFQYNVQLDCSNSCIRQTINFVLKSDNDIVIRLRLSLTVNKNFSVTLCIKHGTLYTEHFCEKTFKTYKHVDKNVSIICNFQFIKSLIWNI